MLSAELQKTMPCKCSVVAISEVYAFCHLLRDFQTTKYFHTVKIFWQRMRLIRSYNIQNNNPFFYVLNPFRTWVLMTLHNFLLSFYYRYQSMVCEPFTQPRQVGHSLLFSCPLNYSKYILRISIPFKYHYLSFKRHLLFIVLLTASRQSIVIMCLHNLLSICSA